MAIGLDGMSKGGGMRAAANPKGPTLQEERDKGKFEQIACSYPTRPLNAHDGLSTT